jgi:hypothetical protein
MDIHNYFLVHIILDKKKLQFVHLGPIMFILDYINEILEFDTIFIWIIYKILLVTLVNVVFA